MRYNWVGVRCRLLDLDLQSSLDRHQDVVGPFEKFKFPTNNIAVEFVDEEKTT